MAFKAALGPIGDLFQRMPFEAFERQDLARGILEFERAESDKEYCEVEDRSSQDYQPAGCEADLCTFKDYVPEYAALFLSIDWDGERMNVDLQCPRKSEQDKYPQII